MVGKYEYLGGTARPVSSTLDARNYYMNIPELDRYSPADKALMFEYFKNNIGYSIKTTGLMILTFVGLGIPFMALVNAPIIQRLPYRFIVIPAIALTGSAIILYIMCSIWHRRIMNEYRRYILSIGADKFASLALKSK